MISNVDPSNSSTSFRHFTSHPSGQWEVYTANVEHPLAMIHNCLAGTQMSHHDQVQLQYGIPTNSSPPLATSTSTTSPDASGVHTGIEQPLGVIHNGPAGTQMNIHDRVNLQDDIPPNASPLLATSTINEPSPNTSLHRKFPCSVCKRPHPRRDRAEACENSHSGAKPFACLGVCGVFQWYVIPRLAKIQLM
jgi:hypothetical protein